MIIKNGIRNFVILLLIGLAGKILSISAVPIDATHSIGNDEKFYYTQLVRKLYDEHSEFKMFEDRFFNHTKYPFINDCFVKDIHTNQIILCLNYFDMLERLSLSQNINRDINSNYFQEQLKSLDYQYTNKINEFCENLKSYLPQTQRFNHIEEIENYFNPFKSNNIFCIKYCIIDTYTATKTSELINDMCKLILSGNELLNQHDKVNDQPKIHNPLQLGEMQNLKLPKENNDNLNQNIQLNSEQSKDISNSFISEKTDVVTEKLASSLNSVKINNESTVKPEGKSLSDNTEVSDLLNKVNNLTNKLKSNEKQQKQAQLLPVEPQQEKPIKTDTKSTSIDDGINENPKDNDNKNIDNISNNNNNNNNDVSNEDYNVFDRDAKTEINSNEKNTDSELNIADGDIEPDDDDDNYANDKPNILPPISSNKLDEKLKINNNKDINNSNNNNNNNNNNNIDENDERNENNKIIKDPFFEDTESNFSFYFTIFIIFIFLTYFIYHYKNRIIAIALEGRRGNNSLSSRRRKQGAVYKRLDTNLEEAITSNNSNNTGNTSQIIY